MTFSHSEALRRIRQIHIKTKQVVENLFAGLYHSVFKGRGLEFEDVREYQPGDEIRYIDWNVTARMQHPYIKNFHEERELTVILLVDISSSSHFASTHRLKSETMAELGAILALAAIKNQDKVGLILFSDEIELYLSPKKGTRHVLRVIRELLFFQPKHKGTDLSKALAFLGKVLRKRAVCFFISDFLTKEDFSHDANLIAQRHDLIFIQIKDPYELSFPKLGLITLKDLESGTIQLIDSSEADVQSHFKEQAHLRQAALKQLTERIGAGLISIQNQESYIEALRRFFKRREKKH